MLVGLCPGGLCLGGLCSGGSLSEDLCQGVPPYGYMLAVRILLECILVDLFNCVLEYKNIIFKFNLDYLR